MSKTGIEWTDVTWNPVSGCTIVSPGCANCYAMRQAARIERMNPALAHYRGLTDPSNAGPVWNGTVRTASDATLMAPLRWKKPRRVFVNSMSDLFHESVPDAWIDRVFAVMALAPQHTFQILTKRSQRMRDYLSGAGLLDRLFDAAFSLDQPATEKWAADHYFGHIKGLPLPNVWLGVSTERQKEADERIPHLLAAPAAVRFVSAEPLLGPIDLSSYLEGLEEHGIEMSRPVGQRVGAAISWTPPLNWVIVGGESGGGARPMHPDWARSLRDQAEGADIPFFFKQWGEWLEGTEPRAAHGLLTVGFDDGVKMARVGKTTAGATLDGREHREWPT